MVGSIISNDTDIHSWVDAKRELRALYHVDRNIPMRIEVAGPEDRSLPARAEWRQVESQRLHFQHGQGRAPMPPREFRVQ